MYIFYYNTSLRINFKRIWVSFRLILTSTFHLTVKNTQEQVRVHLQLIIKSSICMLIYFKKETRSEITFFVLLVWLLEAGS